MLGARSPFRPDQVVNHEMAHAAACVLEGALVLGIELDRGSGTTSFYRHAGLTYEAEARIHLAGERFEPGARSHDDRAAVRALWALEGSPRGWVEAREAETDAMLARTDFTRIVNALTAACTPAGLDGGDVMLIASEAMRAG